MAWECWEFRSRLWLLSSGNLSRLTVLQNKWNYASYILLSVHCRGRFACKGGPDSPISCFMQWKRVWITAAVVWKCFMFTLPRCKWPHEVQDRGDLGLELLLVIFFPFHLAITARLHFFGRKDCGVLGVSSPSLSAQTEEPLKSVCQDVFSWDTALYERIRWVALWKSGGCFLYYCSSLLPLSAFGRCQLTPHKLVVF